MANRFRLKLGLRARLFVLLLVVVLPALGVILYSGLEQRQEAGRAARASVLSLARAAATTYEVEIAQVRQELRTLAMLPRIREARNGECDRFLADHLRDETTIANLGLIALDGRVLCSALPASPGLNLSDREYFQRTLETGAASFGDYQIGRITGKASINYGFPVRDDQGGLVAVLFAAISLEKLAALVAETKLPQGSVFQLIDGHGTVLIRSPDPEALTGTTVENGPLLEILRAGADEETIEMTGLDGFERIYGFVRLAQGIGGNSVHLALGIPRASVYAVHDRRLIITGATAAALVLLLFAVGWWGSGLLVLTPMNRLLAATRKLAAGDFSARVALSGARDEISEATGAFNDMASRLGAQRRQIENHAAHIDRLNRLYAMLSGSNRTLLNVRDENRLFAEICHLAVAKGGLRLAWAMLCEKGSPGLRLAACAGIEADAVPKLVLPQGEGPEASGSDPIAAALAEGKDAILNRLAGTDHPVASAAHRLGCGSLAAIPFRRGDALGGVYVFAAATEGFFESEELDLLCEVAADTTLGLKIITDERSLHDLAYTDRLTGLPNASAFEAALARAVDGARAEEAYLGVQIVGVAGMGEIDGTMGPAAGDAVLRDMARALAQAGSENPALARVGRKEFGIVLGPLASLEALSTRANALLEGVPSIVTVSGHSLSTRPYSGIAVHPYDGANAQELIRRALIAHHRAARTDAKEIVFYTEEFDAENSERKKIESELRHAVGRNELALHYQPIVSLGSGEIVGAEALLRWHNPYLGSVAPGKFIPIAEESALIDTIGDWVLATACLQAQGRGHAISSLPRLSINVSPAQLRRPDFVDRIKELLARSGDDKLASRLEFEITESGFMADSERLVRVVREIKDLGVAIAIDDFGTGHSSLSRIKELDVDTLKIDRSFVVGLETESNTAAVVRAIVAMARGFDLAVVAEGVETESQVRILREFGCGLAQGYWFGPPQPPGTFGAGATRKKE